ncbi:opsin [Halobacteriales archaeon QH_1_68_42]|nr:MAG: opsin [Halobacteriales archaeon QH_1_68_42]
MVETTVWFGTGTSVFFLGAALFVWFAVARGEIRSPLYYLPPLVATLAGVSYAGMTAVTLGVVDGATVQTIRFADWLVTTPLITYYLARLAGTERSTRVVAVATNALMIGTGYGFVALSGALRWVAFAASTTLLVGLVYLFGRAFRGALTGASRSARSLYVSLRDLTVATWSVYPVVYFLGPLGVGVIRTGDLDLLIAALDVTAKVGLVAIILLRQYELSEFFSREVAEAA